MNSIEYNKDMTDIGLSLQRDYEQLRTEAKRQLVHNGSVEDDLKVATVRAKQLLDAHLVIEENIRKEEVKRLVNIYKNKGVN